jgi:hypothetical protein
MMVGNSQHTNEENSTNKSLQRDENFIPTTQDLLSQFVQSPVDFIRQIIAEEAGKHLANLKEEAELRGALNAFRKSNPDFVRFEPLILQEVGRLIQNDPDGDIDPWEKLLEKASENFKKKFQAMLEEGSLKPLLKGQQPPFIESSNNRIVQEHPPRFSRTQIANMSMGEYLKNEAAIDDALKSQRII